MQSFVRFGKNGICTFDFVITDRTVCSDYARVAYGVPRSTWDSNLARLRQPEAMQVHAEMRDWDRASSEALRHQKQSSTQEAVD
eukprot:5635245-Pleurochrysis_carterae.AAC.1